MSTTEEVLQAVAAYVQTCTGVAFENVVLADSDAVRIASPYYTIRVISDVGVGGPSEVYGLTAGERPMLSQVHERRDMAIQVDAYGQAALAGLETVAARWAKQGGAGGTLRAAGVHVYRVGSITNLSRLRDMATEPRFMLTMYAYTPRADVAEEVDAVSVVVVDTVLQRDGADVFEIVQSFDIPPPEVAP